MAENDLTAQNYDPSNDLNSVKDPKVEIERFHSKALPRDLVKREREILEKMMEETLELAEGKYDNDLASINAGCVQCGVMINDAEQKIDSAPSEFDRTFHQAKAQRVEQEDALAQWKGRKS